MRLCNEYPWFVWNCSQHWEWSCKVRQLNLSVCPSLCLCLSSPFGEKKAVSMICVSFAFVFLLLLPTVHSCFTTPKMCRTKSKSKNKKKLQKVTLLLLSSERMGVKGVPLDKHSTMKWDEKRKKKSFKMSDWILTNITTLNCSTGITLPSTEHLYKYLKKKWMKNVTFGDVLVIPK